MKKSSLPRHSQNKKKKQEKEEKKLNGNIWRFHVKKKKKKGFSEEKFEFKH